MRKTLAILFFFLGMLFVKSMYGYENPMTLRSICLFHCNALAYDDCTTFQQKRQFHQENGERCLKDAKDMCWWWPCLKDRENVRKCWMTAVTAFIPADPRSKLIGMIVAYFGQHGYDCYEEWCNINTKLYWAEYHFEMMEFYEQVLKQG
jgi:hypothetical protein